MSQSLDNTALVLDLMTLLWGRVFKTNIQLYFL